MTVEEKLYNTLYVVAGIACLLLAFAIRLGVFK